MHLTAADAGAPRPVGEIPEIDRVEARLGECLSPDALERATLTGKSWAAEGSGVAGNVTELLDRRREPKAAGAK